MIITMCLRSGCQKKGERRMLKFNAEHVYIGRVAKQMTQQQLADLVYVSRTSIGNWETGKRVPDAVCLANLANALKVDVNYFYTNV